MFSFKMCSKITILLELQVQIVAVKKNLHRKKYLKLIKVVF